MGNLDKIKKLDQEIEAPADFTSPEVLYNELIAAIRKYHPSDDTSLVDKAYRVAYDAHKGQARKSGEPYIIHPLCVAIILAELELDKETIAAGLLHDVLEDTIMTMDEMRAEFGDDVAHLVDGVTKLKHLHLTDSTICVHSSTSPRKHSSVSPERHRISTALSHSDLVSAR